MNRIAIEARLALLVGTALVTLLALSGVGWAAVGPLAVTKTAPNAGATGIARAANVQAYFNNDIRASTVTSSTFKIRKQGTTTWLGAIRSVNNTISPTSTNGGSQSVATLNPKSAVASDSATFAFTSSKAGSTFRCSLDGSSFAGCASPKSYSGLSQGSHTFKVRAIDSAGTVDTTPAT